jgi:DNA repair exonuclease SbcCD nuclease subunit
MSTRKKSCDLKFIHVADTHLGLNWPAIGRRENIQIPVYGKAFGTVVDAAIEEKVDFVIHGGDLVHRPRPPTAAWNRLLQELPRLKEAGIPFIITVGSHDKPESYFDRAGGDVLQILDTRLGLVKRTDTDQNPCIELKTRGGARVSVYGLGDHGREQETQLQQLHKIMKQEADFSILLMHGSVSVMPQIVGSTVSVETMETLLSRKYVDYVALGHNHKRWEHKDLQIYNPGSTEYTSFADAPTISYLYDGKALREENREPAEHGYYLVEVAGEVVKAQFKTIPTRDVRNIEVRFDQATASQVAEGVKTAISQNTSSSGIIRPVIRGTLHASSSRGDINLQEILALREKLLFLEYPLVDLAGSQVGLETTEESDIQGILNQYLKARLGQGAETTADIAMKLVELYARRGRTTNQEALSIIDGWRPSD